MLIIRLIIHTWYHCICIFIAIIISKAIMWYIWALTIVRVGIFHSFFLSLSGCWQLGIKKYCNCLGSAKEKRGQQTSDTCSSERRALCKTCVRLVCGGRITKKLDDVTRTFNYGPHLKALLSASVRIISGEAPWPPRLSPSMNQTFHYMLTLLSCAECVYTMGKWWGIGNLMSDG